MTVDVTSLREELIRLLNSHDWWYGYSDDSRAYQAGKSQAARIRVLIELVPDGQDLYNQARPKTASY